MLHDGVILGTLSDVVGIAEQTTLQFLTVWEAVQASDEEVACELDDGLSVEDGVVVFGESNCSDPFVVSWYVFGLQSPI